MEAVRDIFNNVLEEVVKQMGEDPLGLLFNILIYLSPLFIISLVCSFILLRDMEKTEKKTSKHPSSFMVHLLLLSFPFLFFPFLHSPFLSFFILLSFFFLLVLSSFFSFFFFLDD